MTRKRLRLRQRGVSPIEFCLLLVLTACLRVTMPSATTPAANPIDHVVSQAEKLSRRC